MKILISAFSSLTTDQRILKTCRTLLDAGYDIEFIGCDWGGNEALELDFPWSRIPLSSRTLKTAYPEFNLKLYKKLLRRTRRDTILWANDLDALLPSYLIHRSRKVPLIYDSHEIFTEMPSVEGRFVQKVWRVAERAVLPNIKYMLTESAHYAEWFHQKYGVRPSVVRNVPFYQEGVQENSASSKVKKIIYQGALNPSRGLKEMILAMQFLEHAELHIAGDGPLKSELEQFVEANNLGSKVFFAGKLRPEVLREFTRTADAGLSMEQNGGLSYLYSLPNKVSDYVQARVPVVMIDFPEMKRIYSQFHIGEMINTHEPEAIAKALQIVLDNGKLHYRTALDEAAKELCWENDQQQILELVKKAASERL